MTLSTGEILRLMSDLSEEENMKVTITESLKGGAVTGVASVLGGLCFGPVGFIIGGTLGGLTAYSLCEGKFLPVSSVIMKMEPSKKQILANRVRAFLQTRSIRDAASFAKAMASPALKLILIEIIIGVIISVGGYVIEKFDKNRQNKRI